MSRTIPSTLLASIQTGQTTLCRLLKITCKDGDVYGFTDLDTSVPYDDGTDDITYSAAQGFTPSQIATSNNLSVDNADLDGILANVSADGITEQDVQTGKLDFAAAVIYQVDYNNLTEHMTLARGTLGEISIEDGMFKGEFRSLTQQLKQQIVQVTSLTCRATFGDTKCGYDFTAEWVAGTVTSVDAENDRIFTDSSLAQADDYFVPGIVEWLTGDNAGKSCEVEGFGSGEISLTFPVPFVIDTGDTFRIRRDCGKTAAECKDTWSNLVNFRGEPFIPVAEEGSLQTPGADL